MTRQIPGTIPLEEGREFRYIQGNQINRFEKELFNQLFDSVTEPLAKHGGVISENCVITTPNKNIFYGISYRGDIDGWRKDFECGAHNLSLLFAWIENNNLIDSSGKEHPLSECDIDFYKSPK